MQPDDVSMKSAAWTKDYGAGKWHLALAKRFVTASVMETGRGRWVVSVNGYAVGTNDYESAEVAQAAARRYLRRKLKQALEELSEE